LGAGEATVWTGTQQVSSLETSIQTANG